MAETSETGLATEKGGGGGLRGEYGVSRNWGCVCVCGGGGMREKGGMEGVWWGGVGRLTSFLYKFNSPTV